MSLLNRIEENIILPANDILTGNLISQSLRFLLKSQGWQHERHIEFQNERLRFIIHHAYENIPFYHDLFREKKLVPSDIKNISDLQKIPVINKDDFRKHPPEYYHTRNISRRNIIRLNSSGSTGEPFTYYIDREAFSMNYASAIRGWYWMGYRLGDTYAKLSQNPRSGYGKKIQDMFTRSLYLFIRDLTKENLLKVLYRLNNEQPEYIRCYPDPLLFISVLINEGNELQYSPKAINTTGNILTPESREKIEKAFRAPVFDSYSCEASAQFFEGPDRDVYYASAEYAVTEVIDHMNNPSAMGRHITTDLWNMAMPFIRYDTQDIIDRADRHQNPEIHLPAFKQIKGRNSDILITPSGKYLIVHTFTIFFEYFEEIDQFQVIQNKPDSINVLLVVNERYDKKAEREIYEGLVRLIGNDVLIELSTVKQIPILSSGKRRFIVREESIKLAL